VCASCLAGPLLCLRAALVRKPALIARPIVLTLTASAQADGPASKLDRALREALASGRAAPQTVIIQVRPGARTALRQALLDHGDDIRAEHPAIDALTAHVHGEDLASLANDPAILSMSSDATVVAYPNDADSGTAVASEMSLGQTPWVQLADVADALHAIVAANRGTAVADKTEDALAKVNSALARLAKERPDEPGAMGDMVGAVGDITAAVAARLLPVSTGNDLTTRIVAAAGHLPEELAARRRALTNFDGLRAALGLSGSTMSGKGIGVAVIDSGIAPGVDLAGRITTFYDFTNGKTRQTAPFDDFGHGTHVAGLIGSNGTGSGYVHMGVAPSVRLIGLKVLDSRGRGQTSDVLRAIDFAVANRARFGIDIVNISLGHPILEPASTDPLVQAVERAVAAGLIVVASAGNYGVHPVTREAGYAGITSPGNAPSAITVGTLWTNGTLQRSDDRVALYSSRGPSWYDAYAKPDLVAPGDEMVSTAANSSTLYTENCAQRRGPRHFSLSGSSMSAAVASGVVALVLERSRAANPGEPALTPNSVKGILQYSSTDVAGHDPLTQGAGALNAGGALALAAAFDTSALESAPGTPVISSGVEPYTTIGGQSVEWSRNIVWGTRLVADSVSLWSTNIVWGTSLDVDNIVWGTVFDGENIVWGTADIDNIVWGTTVDWLDNIVWGTSLLTTADGQAIVWGNAWDVDNIVWGTLADLDNIVWGTLRDMDNVVWGTASADGDNIVWGTLTSCGG
jgi:serine protease AprX